MPRAADAFHPVALPSRPRADALAGIWAVFNLGLANARQGAAGGLRNPCREFAAKLPRSRRDLHEMLLAKPLPSKG